MSLSDEWVVRQLARPGRQPADPNVRGANLWKNWERCYRFVRQVAGRHRLVALCYPKPTFQTVSISCPYEVRETVKEIVLNQDVLVLCSS